MRFGDVLVFDTGKDGGPESKVDGFWIFRHKKLFSIALLRFNHGSREAFHSHAFHAVSWLLSGALFEQAFLGEDRIYHPHWLPIFTPRNRMHKVYGLADQSWVLTFRGPWKNTWHEVVNNEAITLTHNRVRVS